MYICNWHVKVVGAAHLIYFFSKYSSWSKCQNENITSINVQWLLLLD